MVFHAFDEAEPYSSILAPEKLSGWNLLNFVPAFGYAGVFLFFVISGFCIHLRWAKAKASGKEPDIQFISFWKRRWIRLYPAYIAAIILFLVWQSRTVPITLDGFFVWDMVSHVLMIHNFDNRTVYSLNGVFWTLAIEEQLYLLYFLLLYLRQRFGWPVVLLVTFGARFLWLAISLSVTKGIGFELPFHEGALANWWIWCLGALAVENHLKITVLPGWCSSLRLAILAGVTAGGLHYFGALHVPIKAVGQLSFLIQPVLWGAAFFFLVNYFVSSEGLFDKATWMRFTAGLGLFSYSLYLTHELILKAFEGSNVFLLVAGSVLFAYVFYLVFEKPFMKYLEREKNPVQGLRH